MTATPLAGIRVLDLSRVLAGPMSAMTLGDLGAEVIKVEHPSRGDDTRDWGLRVGPTQTTYFNSVNRNKRSITLDLQSITGQQIARKIAAVSDVVVQNFKPGAIERLGLGYEQLSALNPGIVYCSISGYDTQGPEQGRPGYDLVVQGEAGLMAMNGEKGQPALKFGVAVVDLFTGMYAAQAIMAALVERARTHIGGHIRLALYDCGVTLTSYCGLDALVAGQYPPRYGNAHPSIVPYGVFDAADGPLVLTIGTNAQFALFCRNVIDRVDLLEDPRFATNLQRSQHRTVLLPLLEAEIKRRARAPLLANLHAAGIPCGDVLGLHEALTSSRATGNGMVQSVMNATGVDTPILSPPFRFDGERCAVRSLPPQLGEHTVDVLKDVLAMTTDEINAFVSAGAAKQL